MAVSAADMTADDIIAVIAAESGIDEARLVPTATLASLDINSLDVVSVLFEIEDRFGIVIEPDAIAPDFTVADFVAHVRGIAAAAPGSASAAPPSTSPS